MRKIRSLRESLCRRHSSGNDEMRAMNFTKDLCAGEAARTYLAHARAYRGMKRHTSTVVQRIEAHTICACVLLVRFWGNTLRCASIRNCPLHAIVVASSPGPSQRF